MSRLYCLALLTLVAACNRDEASSTTSSCLLGLDPPMCLPEGRIRTCSEAGWIEQSCDESCAAEYGSSATGCGFVEEFQHDGCLCGEGGPAEAEGGLCEDLEGPCEINGDCCDLASIVGCVNLGDEALCLDECSDNSDCSSECCVPLEGSGGACAPPSYCVCEDLGSDCTINGLCCGSESGETLCVHFDDDEAYCLQSCTEDSECPTNCCGMLEGGGGGCVSSNFCMNCHQPEEPCETNDECCGYEIGDTYCVNFIDGPTTCALACIDGFDCDSGCCVDLEEGGGACGPASSCGGQSPVSGLTTLVTASPAPQSPGMSRGDLQQFVRAHHSTERLDRSVARQRMPLGR